MSADNQQERLPKKGKYLMYYITGFVDGEGCFSVSVHRHKTSKYGWVVDPMFQVYQHKDNRHILEIIRQTFRCGYITEKSGSPNVHVYIVDNRRDLLEKVIPFFNRYLLISGKHEDFKLFEEIVQKMSERLHWERNGLMQVIKLAFQMNNTGKQRKYSLDTILSDLEESSETTR